MQLDFGRLCAWTAGVWLICAGTILSCWWIFSVTGRTFPAIDSDRPSNAAASTPTVPAIPPAPAPVLTLNVSVLPGSPPLVTVEPPDAAVTVNVDPTPVTVSVAPPRVDLHAVVNVEKVEAKATVPADEYGARIPAPKENP